MAAGRTDYLSKSFEMQWKDRVRELKTFAN